jgi:hypothetical protein
MSFRRRTWKFFNDRDSGKLLPFTWSLLLFFFSARRVRHHGCGHLEAGLFLDLIDEYRELL